jgi:hypothetical protein
MQTLEFISVVAMHATRTFLALPFFSDVVVYRRSQYRSGSFKTGVKLVYDDDGASSLIFSSYRIFGDRLLTDVLSVNASTLARFVTLDLRGVLAVIENSPDSKPTRSSTYKLNENCDFKVKNCTFPTCISK